MAHTGKRLNDLESETTTGIKSIYPVEASYSMIGYSLLSKIHVIWTAKGL